MPRRIEKCQPLLKGEREIGNRHDDQSPTFHRHTNPLMNIEMRCAGNLHWKSDTQVVATLLDFDYGNGHGLLHTKLAYVRLVDVMRFVIAIF